MSQKNFDIRLNSSKPRKLVLIGASTGGPGLLEQIVISLHDTIDFSIVIAQHMDALSLSSFAKRLNRITTNEVLFVQDTLLIENSKIYLLEDSSYFEQNREVYIKRCENNKSFYHPEIDVFFSSAAKIKSMEIVTYLLSGIGQDGAKGMLELKKANFKTVAQDEKTSIVYGMPKSAYELNACRFVMSIDDICQDINRN